MIPIEVHNLVKSYRSGPLRPPQPVLQGVSLRVEEGTVFGLMGPNGAGKTTFIKSLLDIVRPQSGTIRILGGSPADPRVRERIGYLPEKIQFVPGTTALSFLKSAARIRKLRLSISDIELQLERLGLGDVGDKKVQAFSKGMKQRLGVASALLGQPELLILDEPTDGIDPIGRQAIRTIIGEENKRGATVFLNSHLLSETEKICQTVGVLVAGRIVLEGPVDEIRRFDHSWELRFEEGVEPEILASLGFESQQNEGTYIFQHGHSEELNLAIDKARAKGARLIHLSERTRDLEAVLVDLVREGTP